MKKIRSKHNDLLNYFIHDRQDLSPAYVRSCEKFLDSIGRPRYFGGPETGGRIFKVTSPKPQAPSATKKPQMIFKTILEFEKDKT